MTARLRDLPERLVAMGIDRRFAVDLASVIVGARRCALMHVPAGIVDAIRELACEYSLFSIAAKRLRRIPDSRSREGLLFDLESQSASSGEEWAELWFGLTPSGLAESKRQFDAKDLGYPECCIDDYSSCSSLSGHYQKYLRCSERGHWEINRLSAVCCDGFIMPDFFPCSLACEAAVDYSRRFFEVATQTIDPLTIARWRSVMRGVYAVAEGSLICWPNWHVTDRVLHLENAGAMSASLTAVAHGIEETMPREVVILPMHHFLESHEIGAPLEVHVHSVHGGIVKLPCRFGVDRNDEDWLTSAPQTPLNAPCT